MLGLSLLALPLAVSRPPRFVAPLASVTATAASTAAAASTAQDRSAQFQWQEIPIASEALPAGRPCESIGEAIRQGASVVLVENVASPDECRALCEAASRSAQAHRRSEQSKSAGVNPNGNLVRLPIAAAGERAKAVGTPCAEALDAESSAMCERILLRVMASIDEHMPSVVASLFHGAADLEASRSPSLCELHASSALEYSSREPAINVYTAGGEFMPHMDHQSLTVLIPLSGADDEFTGGGTGFWSQDARGHRVEGPTIVLRPKAASAMLFGGHVTHAGVPTLSGERVVRRLRSQTRGAAPNHDRS